MLYKSIIRPLLFSLPPEQAHDLSLAIACGLTTLRLPELWRTLLEVKSEKLSTEVAGLKFSNPIGLAAGLDKNCLAIPFFATLGFGHIEIGTVTNQPQPGNPKPRIFRLSDDQALINRMGFPSNGAEFVATQLRVLRAKSAKLPIIGVNIGKTKLVDIDQAVSDYRACFKAFVGLTDYYVLNVSSPNTPDLRKLQEPDRLKELFLGIQEENIEKRPIMVKIAPDLSFEEIDQILDVCMQVGISAIIATNTTFARSGIKTKIDETGGLSGLPLFERSLEIVKYLAKIASNKIPIIAVGGIANGQMAYQMLEAGASLVQVYTALIYQGPTLVRDINLYLNKVLNK